MAPSVASPAPALVFEPYNGTVAEDPDAQRFPASLAKLMTAYVTFQALKAGTVTLDTRVVCSQRARVKRRPNSAFPSAARSPSMLR
jgi:D-alanyl-D-alanine carboxypeptidase